MSGAEAAQLLDKISLRDWLKRCAYPCPPGIHYWYCSRADSRFVSSQWETALLCNDVSHWLDASLESAQCGICKIISVPPKSIETLIWQYSVWYGQVGIRLYFHYDDVIMSAIASHITSLTIVYSTVYPGAVQSKHQSSASLAHVWGIHRGPVNYPHKWPVTRKMFPFDDVIMFHSLLISGWLWIGVIFVWPQIIYHNYYPILDHNKLEGSYLISCFE